MASSSARASDAAYTLSAFDLMVDSDTMIRPRTAPEATRKIARATMISTREKPPSESRSDAFAGDSD